MPGRDSPLLMVLLPIVAILIVGAVTMRRAI